MAAIVCMTCEQAITFDDEGEVSNGVVKNKIRVAQKGGTPCYCCTDCNRLWARIEKAQKSMLGLKGWAKGMDQEEKANKFRDNVDSLGSDLAANMDSFVKDEGEEQSMSESGESDSWLDEHDLMTRYKGREDQARSIMENAGNRIHPHRKVVLYQDLKIKSKRSSRCAHKTTYQTGLSTEDKLKKPKVAKVPAPPKEKKPKAMSEATAKKLGKSITKAEGYGNDLESLLDKVADPSYADYIGKKFIAKPITAFWCVFCLQRFFFVVVFYLFIY